MQNYLIRTIFVFEFADSSMVRIQMHTLIVMVTQSGQILIHGERRHGSELCLDGLIKRLKQQQFALCQHSSSTLLQAIPFFFFFESAIEGFGLWVMEDFNILPRSCHIQSPVWRSEKIHSTDPVR